MWKFQILFAVIVCCMYHWNCIGGTSMRKQCPVHKIKLQEGLDLKKFTGIWYDIARLPQHHDNISLSSGTSRIQVFSDGRIHIAYTGQQKDGVCIQTPLTASGKQLRDSRLYIKSDHTSKGFLKGPFWVVKTDYNDYALVYGCTKVKPDGTCHRHHELVYIISRTRTISDWLERRLSYIVATYLCVNPYRLVYSQHQVDCPLEIKEGDELDIMLGDSPIFNLNNETLLVEDRKDDECKFSSIPVYEKFEEDKVAGMWYVLATYRDESSSTSNLTSASIFLKPIPSGGFGTFFTAAIDGKCFGRTFPGSLKKVNGNEEGQFYADYGKIKGPIKFTYFTPDNEYAISYTCSGERLDGSCEKTVVDVLSRKRQFLTEDVRDIVMKEVEKLCSNPGKLTFLDQSLICNLDTSNENNKECKAQIHPPSKVDWKSLLGYWYTTAYYGESVEPSMTWVIDMWAYTAFRMHRQFASDGECTKRETKRVTFDYEASFQYKSNEESRSMQVLFLDGNTILIVYQCTALEEDGTCDQKNMSVHFITRARYLAQHQIQTFKYILDKVCIQMGDIKMVNHDVNCDPSPREEMYYEKCVVKDIPTQKDFNSAKFAGHWHSLAVSKQGSQMDTIEIDIEAAEDNSLTVWYSGAKAGTCASTARFELIPKSNNTQADFTAVYGRFEGQMKVVYTDYDNYALVYDCDLEDKDTGKCADGHELVEILGRDHVATTQEILNIGEDILKKTCFQLHDIKLTYKAISCHPIKEPESCKVQAMPTRKDFSVKQILGTWYRVSINKDRNQLDDVQVHVSLNSEREVSIAMAFSMNSTCQPGSIILGSLDKANPAIWHMKYGRYVGTSLMAYLDGEYGILYHCTRELSDGTCAPLRHYVTVIARNNNIQARESEKLDEIMRSILPDLCTEPAAMEDVVHTRMCTPMLNHGICKIDTLPLLKEFDMQKFLGVWYPIMKLKGSHTLHGSMIKFKEGNDGQVHVFFTGVGHVKDRCLPTMKGVLSKPSAAGAELFISYGDTRGRMRVVFTNYDIALLYTCDHETDNGHCFAGQTSVDILSRSRIPNQDLKFPLLRRTKDLCVDPKLMVDVDHSVECELEPEKDCSVEEIPVAEGIKSTNIMGTWYSAAKVRGSSSWESGVINFELKRDPELHILALFAGSRRGHCLPTREIALYPGNITGLFSVDSPDSNKIMKLVAYRKDFQYALLYQCNIQMSPTGRCAPGESYVDMLSRDRKPLPQEVLNDFAEITYKYLCHQRSEFVTTSHMVSCDVNWEKTCIVNYIPSQKNTNLESILGDWYNYYQLRTSVFAPSSRRYYIMRDAEDDTKFVIKFATSRNGNCEPTYHADFVADPMNPERGILVQEDNQIQGDFLILYSDDKMLLYYECFRKRSDGSCFPEDVGIELLLREEHTELDQVALELVKKILPETCYNWEDFELVNHSLPCYVQKETPKKCDISNLPIQSQVDLGKLLGKWYNVARIRGSGEWSSGSAEIEVIEGSDMVRMHYVVAVNGVCFPTLAVVWVPLKTGHSEWRSIIGSQRGYAGIIYLDDDTLVVYECDVLRSENECIDSNQHVDIYSRTSEPIEHTTVSKLMTIMAKMCLRMEYFEEVPHDLTCEIDHEPFIDCTAENLPLAEGYDLEMATGTWYSVMRLKGSGFINAQQMRITKAENSGYDVHIMGARKAQCLQELHAHIQPKRNNPADAIFTTDTMTATMRTLYYDENYRYQLTYQCAMFQKDGRCAPGSVGLTLYARSTEEVSQGELEDVWNTIESIKCIEQTRDDFEVIPHGVTCDLHGEDDDEYCDYNNIQAQPVFDPRNFTGTWYHIYRLRSSPQKYDSEVNYVDIMPDGKLRSYSSYFRDGRCSSTKTSQYKPTPNQGEWWFGTHGGIKIVYTDYDVAVIYVCTQSHYDDSCYPRDSEIEVLSRSTEPLSKEASDKLKVALRSLCLEIGDFDKTNHQVSCNVQKVHCNINGLPEHPDFNMEMFTGTWHPVARLRHTLSYDGFVFRIARSEDPSSPDVYTIIQRHMEEDECTDPVQTEWTQKGAATYTSLQGAKTALFRVLYTDYKSTVFYICHELYNATNCLPGEETVYVLSHSHSIDDTELSEIISNVPETCFSKRSFEWVPKTGNCEIATKVCAIKDLPAEPGFDKHKFSGVWYGMHQVRGHGQWQNGVVKYKVMEDGNLKVTATGTRDGVCLESSTFVSLEGEKVYEWNVIVGGTGGRVRILDASDLGDDHAVIYECQRPLLDGTCHPDYTFIDVISRKMTPFPEENRVHLRSVIRQACLEPGDFTDAKHDVECALTEPPQIPCDLDNLPVAENINLRQFSGDWYAVAKLNTSSTSESTKTRIHFRNDGTVYLHFVAYRARRGCTPTTGTSLSVNSTNPALWYKLDPETNSTKIHFKILWTDYNLATAYSCMNVLEDGSCKFGFEHMLLFSRRPDRLTEEEIHSISVLGSGEGCLDRNSFRWVSHDVKCDLVLPTKPLCSVDQLPITRNFSEEQYLGEWFMRYTLRKDHKVWQNSKMKFNKTSAGNYKSEFLYTINGNCVQGSCTGYPTAIPGVMTERMGEHVGELRTLYLDDNFLLSYTCFNKDKEGYCVQTDEAMALFTREVDSDLPENVLDWLVENSKSECYEPGDFVPVSHSGACDYQEPTQPIKCVMAELPIQPNFDFDKMTGTWYAMAAHNSNKLFPSSVMRIEKLSDQEYHLYSTSLGAKGNCRNVKTTRVKVDSDRYPGEYETNGDSSRSRMKIVYTDYSYALVYKCMRVTFMGDCEKGEDFFIVYSRSASLPNDAVQRLITMAELKCVSADSFTLQQHPVLCELRSPKLDTVFCRMRNIPAQDNFVMEKFTGVWYGHYKLESAWKTLVTRYEIVSENDIAVSYTGEYTDKCFPERKAHIKLDSGGRAIFYGDTAATKIVYTDYEQAVAVNCEQILPDGTCDPKRRYLNILSRELLPIPEKKLARLMEAVREACFEPGDLIFTPHNVDCQLSRSLSCDQPNQLPSHKNLHSLAFTGVWYDVARLRGTKLANSQTINIQYLHKGVYSVSMISARKGECQTITAKMQRVNESDTTNSDYHLMNSDDKIMGLLRIMYTDYNKALVYMCFGAEKNLLNCSVGNMSVTIYSRSASLQYSEVRRIVQSTGQDCYQEDQFKWSDRSVVCELNVPPECVYSDVQVAQNLSREDLEGQWYTRYQLRGVPSIHYESIYLEILEDGNIKTHHTGGLYGKCMDHTNAYIHWRTEDPAIYNVVLKDGKPSGQNKYVYVDADHMMMYFCGKITEDGTCSQQHARLGIYARSRTEPVTGAKMDALMKIAKASCFEYGQMVQAYQQVECNATVKIALPCDMNYFASRDYQPTFDMEKYCGTWYPVSKVKGSYMADNSVFRTEASADRSHYITYSIGAMGGDCISLGGWKVNTSQSGFIQTYSSDWSIMTGLSKVLYWSKDGNYVVLYHCSKPLASRNGDTEYDCMAGYEVTTIMSRSQAPPPSDVMTELIRHMRQCLYIQDMEPVAQNVQCPVKSSTPSQCQLSNIQGKSNVLHGDMMGKWYIHYTLRQDQATKLEYGLAIFSVIDKTHFKGEFAFKTGGECKSVDTVYHASDDNPGELFINIGPVSVSIKILFQDDKYMIFYECETVQEDGSCDPNGHFVMIFGSSPEAPTNDDLYMLRKTVRSVCLEIADFDSVSTDGECEIKIDRRQIGCSLTKLPVQENFVVDKDTGHWYAVAVLRGSNFLSSLHEVGVVDYEKQMYSFYSSGRRGRGGCTDTLRKDIPFAALSENKAKVTISTNNHTGVWQMLYNDYRYALVYRCANLLTTDICAPGQSYVAAYSRKRNRIPLYMIDEMLRAVSPACFTWDDFVWLDLEDECDLNYDQADCRIRNIPAVENFQLERFAGDWYSRFLLVRNTVYDSFAARYEVSEDNGTVKLYHNGVSGGSCRRVQMQQFRMPDKNRGVFRWGENDEKISKVVWTDYDYALIYTCNKIQEDDSCAPDNVFIDVLSKKLSLTPLSMIERLKKLLVGMCFTPGDFVGSDHTLQCDENSCTIGSVVTQRDLTAQSVFGAWQLIARTTHIKTERGPTTMDIMKGKNGNARFAMARNHADGCNNYEVFMPVKHDGTFYYTHDGLPGLFKIIYSDDEYLLLYDCFGAEPELGRFCPEENQEVQLWGRKHFLQESVLDKAMKIATERTCVSLSNFERVPQNIACTVQKSCMFDDLVEQENFDPRTLLGSWELLAKSMYFDPIFETGTMKIAYSGEEDVVYNYAGELLGSAECASHSGRMVNSAGEKAVYHMTYKSLESIGKYLYVDNDNHVLFECWSNLVDGVCPENKSAIFIFGKTMSSFNSEKRELILKEIRQSTFGCYDTKKIHIVRDNTCDVVDPIGRLSCNLNSIENYRFINTYQMMGLWFLVARSDLIGFKWDAGILHLSIRGEEEGKGEIWMQYTGLKAYDSKDCWPVSEGAVEQVKTGGDITGFTYVQDGVKTSARILYMDDDMFIWYECRGNKATSNGDCQHGNEHIDVYSRRKKLNTFQMNKVKTIISDKTCMNVDKFVYANHTSRMCHLPGVTDVKPDEGVIRPVSCRVWRVPVQQDFDLEQFGGLWYEVERTRFAKHNTWESSLTAFQVKDQDTMVLRHAGTQHGDCRGPIVATARAQSPHNRADMRLYLGDENMVGSPWTVSFIYKIVYTDYTNVAIVYACKFWRMEDGICDHQGLQVDILSRTKEIDDETRQRLYNIIQENICVDMYDFVEPVYQESCHDLVGEPEPIKASPLEEIEQYPCAMIMCAEPCPYGYGKNEQGCETCVCLQAPPMQEEIIGEGGDILGENMVIENEDDIENVTGLPDPVMNRCVIPVCDVPCIHGYQIVDGCKTCTCQEVPVEEHEDLPCPPVACAENCPYGEDWTNIDHQGCTVCTCQEKVCPMPMCSEFCPGGYADDADGCMTCICLVEDIDESMNEVNDEAHIQKAAAVAKQDNHNSGVGSSLFQRLAKWLN